MKTFFSHVSEYIRNTDRWTWLLCLVLSGTSLIMIAGILQSGYAELLNINTRTFQVQCVAIAFGIICAIVLSRIDYLSLIRLWKLHVPFSYLFVFLTFVIGTGVPERVNDKRWIKVPFAGITIQPAELLKISFILILAYHLYKVHDRINQPLTVLGLCLHGAIPVVLIHFQGDDGTAMLFASIFLCMLFLAGISWKYIVAAVVWLIALLPVAWFFLLNNFQKSRIITLLNQSTADPLGEYYQQYRAKYAIASGGIRGKGIFVDSHIYVPEMHNDFIFAFLCESLGFMGGLAIICIIIALSFKILANGRLAQNLQGQMICAGVFAMIFFQSAVNIAMCLSLLPVIGNTLPFLSYGGSSVLTNYLGIGLALSVYMHSPKTLFSK